MRMAPRAAAWVAWAEWTCNTPHRVFGQKGRVFGSALFFGLRVTQRMTQIRTEAEQEIKALPARK